MMAKAKTKTDSKPRVKLTGQNGNAFNLLGICQRVAREAGWSNERVNEFLKEAQSGDYDNLLRTCHKYFDVR